MYSVPISIREARAWIVADISPDARIPHGSKCVWYSGVKWITDQPGLYLVSGVGGLEGVQVIPPAVERAGEKSA